MEISSFGKRLQQIRAERRTQQTPALSPKQRAQRQERDKAEAERREHQRRAP